MTTKKTTVKEFKQELIDSILNEKRNFDMRSYTTDDWGVHDRKPAFCKTASCMAGHIEALRPRLAKKLAQKQFEEGETEIVHARLARDIWKEVTGEECRLAFFGETYDVRKERDELGEYEVKGDWFQATREEAVAHIKGRSKKWPLLAKDAERHE